MQVGHWYDTLADGYDASFWRTCDRAEDQVVRDWLAPHVGVGRVLDVGCGTGLLLDVLPAITAHRYVGVDVSAGMVRVARAKHPGYRFVVADAAVVAWPMVDCVVGLFGAANYLGVRAFAAKAAGCARRCVAVVLTPTYVARQHYVPIDPTLRFWTPAGERETRAAFAAGFAHVDVRPLDWLAEYADGQVGVRTLATYLKVESRVLGLLRRQDKAGMLFVTAWQ